MLWTYIIRFCVIWMGSSLLCNFGINDSKPSDAYQFLSASVLATLSKPRVLICLRAHNEGNTLFLRIEMVPFLRLFGCCCYRGCYLGIEQYIIEYLLSCAWLSANHKTPKPSTLYLHIVAKNWSRPTIQLHHPATPYIFYYDWNMYLARESFS